MADDTLNTFIKSFAIIIYLSCSQRFVSCNKMNILASTNEVHFRINDNLELQNHKIANFMENGTLLKNSETCNETMRCENGGTCLQHVCLCPPGTSGPYCSTIDDCKENKLCIESEYTYCTYNKEKQRAECKCRAFEKRFDDATRTCRDCKCTDALFDDPDAFNYCVYQQGEKVCACSENYSFYPKWKICKTCNCGEHSKWCEFDENGNRLCVCEDGYTRRFGKCEKCDCGVHGLCEPDDIFHDCICDSGYSSYNHTCVECSCGKYGKCVFDTDGQKKGCDCNVGYAERSGKCEMCFCGENSNCTFNGKDKFCECSSGYKNVNGFCVDIDECKEHNRCKLPSECVNSLGSYKCICAEGYSLSNRTELAVCEDINECKNQTVCSEQNTECLNTLGSFVCICEEGFVSRGSMGSSAVCEKSSKSAIYTVVFTTFFITLIITAGLIIYMRRKFQTSSSNTTHELQ